MYASLKYFDNSVNYLCQRFLLFFKLVTLVAEAIDREMKRKCNKAIDS